MKTARREFIRNVGIGGVAVVGTSALGAGILAGGAAAQTGGGDASELSAADLALLNFLESVELAAAEAYTQAIGRHLLNAPVTETCRNFSSHHAAHGDALAALAGGPTGDKVAPNPGVLSAVSAQIQGAGDASALLGALAGFAERVAATGQSAMEQLSSLVAAGVVSRISPVDAQQAAVLGQLASLPPSDWLPITQSVAGAFTPAAFPA